MYACRAVVLNKPGAVFPLVCEAAATGFASRAYHARAVSWALSRLGGRLAFCCVICGWGQGVDLGMGARVAVSHKSCAHLDLYLAGDI